MLLAGVDHITVAPKLLQELASTQVDPSDTAEFPSLFDQINMTADKVAPKRSYADDEHAFRAALKRDSNVASEDKLVQVCWAKRADEDTRS